MYIHARRKVPLDQGAGKTRSACLVGQVGNHQYRLHIRQIMIPWLFLAILLGFPLLELWAALLLAQKIGWWLLAWLVGAAFIGVTLIREEQFAIFGRLMGAVQQGQNPLRAIFSSGRVMLAGLLLIFPGVLSDVFALILLMWPRQPVQAVQKSDVIEGEFRREEEQVNRLEK